jgi:1-deoxyxylulose-5-phosphate synthase
MLRRQSGSGSEALGPALLLAGRVPLARVVLGGDFGERPDAESFALLDSYAELGGRALETAHGYARGQAERQLGRWLRAQPRRGEFVLIDKCCHPGDDNASRVNAEAIERDCAESLDRLGLDQIDLLLLHRDDAAVPVGEIAQAFHLLIQAGWIRAWGVSNWAPARIERVLHFARGRGLTAPCLASLHYSLAQQRTPPWVGCRSASESDADWLQSQGIPLLSWSALARGWLAQGACDPLTASVYDSDLNRHRRARAASLAQRKAATFTQVALSFALSRSNVAVTVGPRSVAEVRDCMEAPRLHITESERRWLLDGETRGAVSLTL